MQDRENIIEQLANRSALDIDEINSRLDQLAEEHGLDEINDALNDLEDRIIPTGEGLTRKQARKLLVKEMDILTVLGNQKRLRTHRERVNAWYEGKRAGKKVGQFPTEPVFVKGFSEKRLNEAVFKARQLGTYSHLLLAAGY